METLYRALNDIDILSNPLKNGIPSKTMIYNLTKKYIESTNDLFYNNLTVKEKDLYIKDNMNIYLINHEKSLEKKFLKYQLEIKNTINHFVTCKDNKSYFMILYYLSKLNNHLVNGSKVYTDWISTSTSFDNILKYYDNQDIHKIAIINISTNNVFNEDTFVVNVSNKDMIKDLRCLSKKIEKSDLMEFVKECDLEEDDELLRKIFHKYIFERTNKSFMGYNFSSSSSEVCIYNYITSKNISWILESLEIDLIFAEIFNGKYLELDNSLKLKYLNELKQQLRKVISKSNNKEEMYIFDELYIKNKNIDLICEKEMDKKRVELIRNKIINKAYRINSPVIRR